MSQSFRSSQTQARKMAKSMARHGTPRSKLNGTRLSASLGTERTRREAFTGLAAWLKKTRNKKLNKATPEDVELYLLQRSFHVCQNVLDKERVAFGCMLDTPLTRISAQNPERGLATQPRAYRLEQVEALKAHMSPKNAFATDIIIAAGLRAHELLTLKRLDEGEVSDRDWDPARFEIFEGVQYYLVHGKGGLIRQVAIPDKLASEIELRRLPEPREVIDREIIIKQYYDLTGGQRWSNAFSRASRLALGWSTGGHGLRHTFAQQALCAFIAKGCTYQEAILLVSQLLGHFRPGITEVYLR